MQGLPGVWLRAVLLPLLVHGAHSGMLFVGTPGSLRFGRHTMDDWKALVGFDSLGSRWLSDYLCVPVLCGDYHFVPGLDV